MLSVIITATTIAIGVIGGFEFTANDSIQSQGISVLDRTVIDL